MTIKIIDFRANIIDFIDWLCYLEQRVTFEIRNNTNENQLNIASDAKLISTKRHLMKAAYLQRPW